MSDVWGALETLDAPRLNGWIQSGAVDLTFNSEARTEASIVFPTAFLSAPIVVLTVENDNDAPIFVAMVQDITTTGCDVRGGRVDGSTLSITVPVHWIAIGDPDVSTS